MKYTITELLEVLFTKDCPRYLLFILCKEEEKAVFETNVNSYLDTVECLICTLEEYQILWKTENTLKAAEKIMNLSIGLIYTQPGLFKHVLEIAVWGTVQVLPTQQEREPQTDLRVMITHAVNELLGTQVLKYCHGCDDGKSMGAAEQKRMTHYLADLMLTGRCSFSISHERIGRMF